MKSLTRGHFKVGLDSLQRSKWRNFWTILGVIIGVTSVITIVGIGEGVKQQVSGQIQHYGKNLVTIRPAQLQTTNDGSLNALSGGGISGLLTNADVTAVAGDKQIASSSALTAASDTVSGDSGSYQAIVIGTSSALPDLLNQDLAYGSYFNDADSSANVVVLGSGAAERLFNVDVPLGRSITYHGQQFVVRGIFNAFDTTPLSPTADFNNAVFIPYQLAEQITNNTAPIYQILAKPTAQVTATQAIPGVRAAISKNHGGANDFSVLPQDQNVSANNNVLELLTRLISSVAAISLLVSGVGITNVMLVSVTERMHEIGIRKAIGATNRQILSQFLVEATVLSFSGGIIGIVLSYVIDLVLRLSTDLRPAISWQIVALAAGVSLLVGMFFGSVPALKAARKDPIEALRSE